MGMSLDLQQLLVAIMHWGRVFMETPVTTYCSRYSYPKPPVSDARR